MRDAVLRVIAVVAVASVLSALALPSLNARGGSVIQAAATIVPVDRDRSGKWDTLLVNVTLNVTGAGLFEVTAVLPSVAPGNPFSSTTSADVNLTVGVRVVPLVLDATPAGAAGAKGPYTIDVSVTAVRYDGGFTPLFSWAEYTPAWDSSSFDPPAVHVSGTITDEGRDADGDGLFEAFVVHVPLQVVRPTVVSVVGYSSPVVLSNPAPARLLQPGTAVWDVVFDGSGIRRTGRGGPYPVALEVSAPRGTVLSLSYVTRGYSSFQFAGPWADFRGAPTATPVDTNGDGKAEFLRVHIPLHVRVAGDFRILVIGNTSTEQLPPPVPERHVHLEPGDPSVDVDLSGIMLSRLASGSALTFLVSIYPRYTGSPGSSEGNWTQIAYAPFDPAAFESRPPALLSRTVNGTNAYLIAAMDPTTKFAATFPFRGPIGYLTLYNGTFEALLGGTSGFAGRVVGVRVQGYTVLNVTTIPAGDPRITETLNLTSWDTGTMDYAISLGGLSAPLSWWADYVGNLDGTADPQELALYPFDGYIGNSGYAPYAFTALLPPYRNTVTVDGTAMSGVSSWVSATGAGPLDASLPVSLTVRHSLQAMGPTEASGFHNLTVDTTLVTAGLNRMVNQTLTMNLPAGSTGNLSTSRHLATNAGGFDLASNASVEVLGPASWTVAFLSSCYPYFCYSMRVTVSAYQPPTPLVVPVLVAAVLVPTAAVLVLAAVLLRHRRRKADLPRKPD